MFPVLFGTAEDRARSIKIFQKLENLFHSALEAFGAKSYKTAVKYYKNAVDLMTSEGLKTILERTLVSTKYMLCMCWLESTDPKELTKALKTFEELRQKYASVYPMLYYAAGKAYFKLYRFSDAEEILKHGFAALNVSDSMVDKCFIPGTKIVIPESSKERLVAALVDLNDQCSSWHRPDAVCCMTDCSNGSHKGTDRNIFFRSPTFNGMVQVSCDNPSNSCVMSFHPACWKAKKDVLGQLGKMSDKEVLNTECFTPNCENEGVHCSIKKIEIFDENTEVRATIVSSKDSVRWHAKPTSTPKGAMRKQQQLPKTKSVPNESRARLERNTRASSIPNEQHKVNETEEDDDLQAAQKLKWATEKLRELRAKDFGIENDMIWRPDLSMYGNSFMLTTAEALPDPDFADNDPEEQEIKAFTFSWFYTTILSNGPMKLACLEEKWEEAKNMITNWECILRDHFDIAEFLLQSLKFAVVGDYICTADNLPAAYDLAKFNACELLKFFMENDVDQRSNSSSMDDEVVYNDFINQEKNNNSLMDSSMLENYEKIDGKSNIVTSMSVDVEEINDEMVAGMPDSVNVSPTQLAPQEQPKQEKFEKFTEINKAQTRDHAHTLDFSTSVSNCDNSTNENSKIQKEDAEQANVFGGDGSSKPTINGAYSVHEIEEQISSVKTPTSVKPKKLAVHSKSTNDLNTHVASLENIREISINHSGEPDNGLESINTIVPSASLGMEIKEKKANSENHPVVDTYRELNDYTSKIAKLEADHSLELMTLKDEIERLKSQLTHSEKNHNAMRGRFRVYLHYQSIINAKLGEWRKNYEFISSVQQILNNIGETLPINPLEYWKIVIQLEKIAKTHEQSFMTQLDDQLSENKQLEKLEAIELRQEDMPNFPKFELNDIIQSAFVLYKMHQMKEFQKLPLMSCPPPLQQHQPNFRPPHYGQRAPYFPPNLHDGHSAMFYGSQQNFMHAMATQPPVPGQQQMGLLPRPPSLLAPLPILRQVYSNGQNQEPNLVKNFLPTHVHQKFNSLGQQHLFSQQNSPAFHNANISVPDVRMNFSFPAGKIEQKAFASSGVTVGVQQLNFSYPVGKTTDTSLMRQQNFSQRDQTNGPNNAVQTNGPIEKSISRNFEQQKSVPAQQNEQRKVGDFATTNTKAILSYSDCNPRSSDDIIDSHSASPHKESDARITGQRPVESHGNPEPMPTKNADENSMKIGTKLHRRKGHSMDKLMQKLRSQHTGVLEWDLLKSVEDVRKKFKNSLSTLPMRRIIREAEIFIVARQKQQLCGYEQRQGAQFFSASNANSSCSSENERKRLSSITSNSYVNSLKREQASFSSSGHSKKQWELVSFPNDTWVKETVESECVICFNPIEEQFCTLQCKHTFHKTCIKIWYKESQSCPTCRMHSTIDDEYPPLPLG